METCDTLAQFNLVPQRCYTCCLPDSRTNSTLGSEKQSPNHLPSWPDITGFIVEIVGTWILARKIGLPEAVDYLGLGGPQLCFIPQLGILGVEVPAWMEKPWVPSAPHFILAFSVWEGFNSATEQRQPGLSDCFRDSAVLSSKVSSLGWCSPQGRGISRARREAHAERRKVARGGSPPWTASVTPEHRASSAPGDSSGSSRQGLPVHALQFCRPVGGALNF